MNPGPPELPPDGFVNDGSIGFYATCNPGMEEALAMELRAMNAIRVTPSRAGVHFYGQDLELGIRCGMQCAVACQFNS